MPWIKLAMAGEAGGKRMRSGEAAGIFGRWPLPLFMDRARVLEAIDAGILFCFCVFLLFLPLAHTESVRAFSLGIPLGLWLIKMIIRRKWLFARTALDFPLLLFTLTGALSLLTAVDFRYSLEEFGGEWVAGLLVFYAVASTLRPGRFKYILGTLLLGNLLLVGFGLVDFFHQGGVLLDYRIRAGSLHSGYGTYSTYLVMVIPYLLLAVSFVRRSPKWLLLALLLLNLLALYTTFSRGAWVAAAVSILLAGWVRSSRKLPILLLGMIFLLALFLAPDQIIRHYTGISIPGERPILIETFGARWEMTKFTLEKIRENPFGMLGWGQRSFYKKYSYFHEQYEKKYPGAQLWHAHNTFLNITLQTGIIGLALFLFLLFRLLWFLFVRARTESRPEWKFYFQATAMMVISFFVRNLSDDFFIDDTALLFWFLLGMVSTGQRGSV